MNEYDIFVSYAREDEAICERLVERLRGAGFVVWWDRRLGLRKAFDLDINQALRRSRAVVVLWSPDALESRWVRGEAGSAAEQGKPVFSALVRPIDKHALPPPLQVLPWFDLTSWDPEHTHHPDAGVPHPELKKLLGVLGRPQGTNPDALARALSLARLVARRAVPVLLVTFILLAGGVFDALGLDSQLRLVALSVRDRLVADALHPDLVLVTIDKTTEAALGPYDERWRAHHAVALGNLTRARVAAFDIVFEEPTGDAQGTEAMAAAIVKSRAAGLNVVLAAESVDARGEPVIAASLRDALSRKVDPTSARAGAGVIAQTCVGRRWYRVAATLPLTVLRPEDATRSLPSLALATVQAFWGETERAQSADRATIALGHAGLMDREIRFAEWEPPLEASQIAKCHAYHPGNVPARYYLDVVPVNVRRGHPSVIPYEELLDPAFDTDRIAGKVVVLGTQLQGRDTLLVWSDGPKDSWGVNAHLAAIDQLLRGTFVRRLDAGSNLMLLLVFTISAALIRLKVPPHRRAARVACLVLLLGTNVALGVAAAVFGVLVDVLYPALAVVWSYQYVKRFEGLY